MAFATEQIELSMCSAQTGLPLMANVYTIEGVTEVDGSPRLMSIGQLVMAICLQRASTLENQIVGVMNEINVNTTLLDGLTAVEAELVKVDVSGQFCPYDSFSYNGQTITYMDFLTGSQELGYGGIDSGSLPSTSTSANSKRVWSYDQVQTVISLVEDKMDALNTISQETLITLQSLTAKRDQTYDMVSNILKSLNNVLVGNANNM